MSGGVWAISTVKNEQDIIPFTVAHLLAQGVNRILIADNGSADRTPSLLHEFNRDHWTRPLVILKDDDPAWYQGRKMTALAQRAAEWGAEWIVPFDADEFWYGTTGKLADVLQSATADVVYARTFEHVPQPDDPDWFSPKRRIVHRRAQPKCLPKVAFRASMTATVHDGNHEVDREGRREHGLLEIREYQYRSFGHFKQKVRDGRRALELTGLPDTVGAHWRSYGAMSDDELGAEWSRMTAPDGLVYDPAP